jgi:hypothetical protein
MKQLLLKLSACRDAREWAADKSWQEIYDTCHRGDWLLWLFYHTDGDRRLSMLAKGHCANTVRHLMKDERSTNAVDAAIAFGNGEITREELNAAAAAAYAASAAAAAAYAASAAASDADAYAASAAASAAASDAYAAAYAASAAAAAAYAASAAAAAAAAASAAAAAAARKNNQQLTADICRKYLPIEVWNITADGQLITKHSKL